MDLSIGVAVGSSLQIALLVIPISVIIGWIVGSRAQPSGLNEGVMTLNFDGFVIAVLFIAVLLVNYLIQDGKSHWLEGVMLMTTYIVRPGISRSPLSLTDHYRADHCRSSLVLSGSSWSCRGIVIPANHSVGGFLLRDYVGRFGRASRG